jgi:hypothetical protein
MGKAAIDVHARRCGITRADERAGEEVLRDGEQPLDQRQPSVELLRVVNLQPLRVVRNIGKVNGRYRSVPSAV